MKCPDGQGNLAVESDDALVERVTSDIKKFYATYAEYNGMLHDTSYDGEDSLFNRYEEY